MLPWHAEPPVIAAHVNKDHIRDAVSAQGLGAVIGATGSWPGTIYCAAGVGVVGTQDTAQSVDHLHPPGVIDGGDAGEPLKIGVVKNYAGRCIAFICADRVAQHTKSFSRIRMHDIVPSFC